MRPDTVQTRKLQALVELRGQLVDQKTAATNRITALLKLCFPQVLEWFDEVGSPLVVAFLRRWPTLPQLQREKPEIVLTFLHGQNCRSETRNRARMDEIARARPLTTDAAVIEPAVLMIRITLDVVESLHEGIAEMERSIREVCDEHPDYAIFASFPGCGARAGAASACRFRLGPDTIPQCRGGAGLQRHRTGCVAKRAVAMGPFPLGLSEIPAPVFPRVRRRVDSILRVGAPVLRPAARSQ